MNEAHIKAAATRWARTVFGAPRHFTELVTGVEVRDEIIERVVTEVVRRTIREERIPSNRRNPSPPRVDPASVDPYTTSTEALRAESEHVAPCAYCRGGGITACTGCSGGRIRCYPCNGSGKVPSPKTGRPINCKVCHKSGTVPCPRCGGTASVTCTGCSGSGYQLCWLTYTQDVRWVVTIHPDTPVVAGHRQLAAERFLKRDEVDAFHIETIHEAAGVVSVEGYRDAGPAILRGVASSLNPQTERVSNQQYLKLAVVRRDVHYEMCGTKGTLVLSGNELTPSPTFWATKPIQLRLKAWAGVSSMTAVVLLVTMFRLRGSSTYFASSNTVVTILIALFGALTISTVATLLRALRPGMKLGPISPIEKGVAGGAALSLVALVIASAVAAPRAREVETALARGDAGRARQVVQALYERQGKSNEALEADDAVSLHEAKALDLTKRLDILDHIAARSGSHAAEARTRARADRLERIRAQNNAKDPKGALASIDQWFALAWRTDGEIAEERAKAEGLMVATCKTEACRFAKTALAEAAATTPDRVRVKEAAKAALVTALGQRDTPNEELLPRLKRLRELVELSHETTSIAKGDPAAIEASQASLKWATTERAKVPVLGAEVAVAAELLEGEAIPSSDGKAARVTHEGLAIYLTLDATKRVRGIYAAGTSKPRAFKNVTWSPNRILSQAVGRPVEVKKPATGSYDMVNARWFENPTQVHARFRDAELIELRIGDAAP